jgi:hypothetical protein
VATFNHEENTSPSYLANIVADDETLAEAYTIIEMSAEFLSDDFLYSFRWWVEMHPQCSAVVCAVVLCVRSAVPNSTRAWTAV